MGTGTASSAGELRELLAQLVRLGPSLEAGVGRRLGAELGVTFAELDVLGVLAPAPHSRLRMKDIGERLLLSKAAVTRLVDRLEARALVERFPCPEDRRVVWAAITPDGRDKLEEGGPSAERLLAEVLGPYLGPGDLGRLRVIIKGLAGEIRSGSGDRDTMHR